MSCDTVTKNLSLMLYGELSFDEEEQVHSHLESCVECRREYARVRKLHHALDESEGEAPAQLLQDSRRQLRASLASAGSSPRSVLERFRSAFPVASFWKPAGALALLAVGFLGGRVSPLEFDSTQLGIAGEAPPVARVRYVQPHADGDVQIVVEEVRQRVLSGSLDDARIKGLLLTAAREANDPGVRVETMDLLKAHSQTSDVRRALLYALQHDSNAGVRLKALEGLRTAPQESDIRRVLAQVLLTDDNPGVRTQAIDLLTQKREPAMVGLLQELMTREDNSYVRMKCRKVLHEMNASAEIF